MAMLGRRKTRAKSEGHGGARHRALVWGMALAWSGLLCLAPSRAVAGRQSPPQEAGAAASSVVAPAGADSAKTTPAKQQPIRVRVNEVNVPVTVLDKRGVPVIDLTSKDFQVYEDGVLQSIRYFYRGERPPLRIGLVLDTSNSARMQLKFEEEAGSEFVFNMLQGENSRNQIFLETFDVTSSIVQDFTNDPNVLNEKIRKLKAGGGKAVYDAIYFACRDKMIPLGDPSQSRRVLVLVSDGVDVQSRHTLDEAISMARRAGTAIYTIGNVAYGFHNPGDKTLEALSEATGAASFFPLRQTAENDSGTDYATGYLSHGQIGDTSQNTGLGAATGIYSAQRLIKLADSLEAIGEQLSDQYSIGYQPVNAKMDGTYRTIKVVCSRKGVEVRAKPGYFATGQ
jgi:VWFA-related protein